MSETIRVDSCYDPEMDNPNILLTGRHPAFDEDGRCVLCGECQREDRPSEAKSKGKGYQLVNWFPEWQGLAFHHNDPRKTDLAYIYEWHLWIAFWEIRKWSCRTLNAAEQERKEQEKEDVSIT